MFVALLIAIVVAAFVASEVFWDLLAGMAIFGIILGAVKLDLGMALFCLALLALSAWRFGRIG